MGLFISFEGIEGSGKTTQIRRLRKHLSRKGIPCTVTREPGGTRIGEKIRKLLLSPDHCEMAPLSELFLYEASRAQHVEEVIRPLLRKGRVVLCDRFSDASLAYQGYGRKVNPSWVTRLNRLATQGLKPDVTFLLDCPTPLGLRRALRRNRLLNLEKEGRFEMEGAKFHVQVRRGYRLIAKREPRRVKLIDTREGEEKVFEKIQKVVDRLIARRRLRVPRLKSCSSPI